MRRWVEDAALTTHTRRLPILSVGDLQGLPMQMMEGCHD